MYRWFQIFLTILKLDIFFFLGFSIQYLVLVLQRGDVEYPLTIVALPLTCIVLLLAVYAVSVCSLSSICYDCTNIDSKYVYQQQVKHESKHLISLFFVGLAAGVAYFIFKIYRMYDLSQAAKYQYVKEFLTFFGK